MSNVNTTWAVDDSTGSNVTRGLASKAEAIRVACGWMRDMGEALEADAVRIYEDCADGESHDYTREELVGPPTDIICYRGVELARRAKKGPRGGVRYIYQHAGASRDWGYWFDSASQAARESNESDRVGRV